MLFRSRKARRSFEGLVSCATGQRSSRRTSLQPSPMPLCPPRFYLVSLGSVSAELEELEHHLGEVSTPVRSSFAARLTGFLEAVWRAGDDQP